MPKWIPEVWALCERVRRPATMLIAGAVLMSPAAAMRARTEKAERAASPELSLDAKLVRAKTRLGPVTEAWEERAAERVHRSAAVPFAQKYRIPVELAATIHRVAAEERIEPKVAFGLVRAESGFRRTVVSPVGAVGYTQVMPSTARWFVPGTTRSDLLNGKTNLRIGFKYLRELRDKYDGNMRLALTAYNRGPGTVDRALKRGRNPENGYAEMILTGKSAREAGHQLYASKSVRKKSVVKKGKKPTGKKALAKKLPTRSTRRARRA